MQLLDANKLGALGTLIRDRTDAALGPLSPSAAAVLSMLHFKPGLTTSEIATVVASVNDCVRLIDGLERQALIKRGEQVGRVTPLSLTKAGHDEAEALQQRRLAALDGLLGALPEKDRNRFVLLLDRVLEEATTSRSFARTTCRLCEHNLCSADVCPIGCKASEIEKAQERL